MTDIPLLFEDKEITQDLMDLKSKPTSSNNAQRNFSLNPGAAGAGTAIKSKTQLIDTVD